MTSELQLILLITLIFIATIFWISSKQSESKQKESNEPKQQKSTKPQSKTSKRDEIINTLDWMLANQIINSKEYSQLIVKCLPFLE